MTDVIETTKVVGNSILVSMDVTSLHRRKEVPLYAKHTKPIPRRHARTYPKGELFPICWEKLSPSTRNGDGNKGGNCICKHLHVKNGDRNWHSKPI